MTMTELPPDLGDEVEPDLPDPPGAERGSAIGFDNEAERAEMRPRDGDYQYGPGASYSGYNDDYTDPYRSLGGLTRPDAYYGAIEFDCPTCQARAKTLDFDGEKCRVFIERTGKWMVRKMPCVARIRCAREAGIL